MASVNELNDIPEQATASDDVFVFPASFAQQRLWFLDKLEPGQNTYNVPFAIRLNGALNLEVLEQAIRELVARHEVLRTTLSEDDAGNPIQLVAARQEFSLSVSDLRSFPSELREAEVKNRVIEHARLPFNLKQGPLFRGSLLILTDTEYVLSLVFHHVVVDGSSWTVLLRELSALYEAFVASKSSPLPPLAIQYGDYAAWQHDWLQGERLDNLLQFWKKQLGDAPPVLELPTDSLRPAVQSFVGAQESMLLSPALQEGLTKFGQKEGATLFMTLLAAFNLLLARYSGQEDIVVGTPISGRTRSELEGLIGFLVNTLPLRTDVSGNPTFRELLARVRETSLQGYAHQDLPFERLVEELRPTRDLSRSPVVQVFYMFENSFDKQKSHIADLKIAPFRGAERTTAKFDLSFSALLNPEGLRVALTYNVDLFQAPTVRRMLGHLRAILEAMIANPDQRTGELRLLDQEEQQQLLQAFNDTATTHSGDLCIHQLFERQVERTPDAIALEFQGRELSYRELNARANQLAHHLIGHGVKPDSRVGICVHRSVEMLIGLLGIMKAGAAYVPIDPAYPSERIEFMLQDGGASVLVTESNLLETVSAQDAKVVCLDREAAVLAQQSLDDPRTEVTPANLSYVIFTSGSTGRPKGVQLEHRNVANFIGHVQRTFHVGANDVYLGVASMSFDASVLDFYLPLSVGARLVIVDSDTARDSSVLAETVSRAGVTVMHATPSTWRSLVDAGWRGSSAFTVLTGGEALSWDLAKELLPRCGALWNLYGPTETAVYSAIHKVSALDGTVLVGRPIANTQIYVLDKHSHLAPIGVPGEIYIAGEGVARGYLNRPDLTAERFVSDPFRGGEARMYRTGDLGRFRPDGVIQCLGRLDHQVKLRGFRIELGEIESVLAEHESVQQCIVIVREDIPGNQQLVAYVVAEHKSSDLTPQFRALLSQRLPNYMVPSAFVVLDALPLTPNGKIDRRALRAPDFTGNGPVVAPRNVLEEKLLAIWKHVLQNPAIGVTDNFFDLGGHSLMAARLVSEMEKALGRKVPLAALFRGATVEEMATVLHEGNEFTADPMVMRIQAGSTAPFFAIVAPGMDAIGYAALAQAMGPEQTFYKLQSHRAVKPNAPITFDEMVGIARDYVEAMRSVQPKGPYYLGGMCAGTHIGEQMVMQLEAEGEKVGLLAIFDTWVRQNSHVRWKWSVYYYRQRLHSMLRMSLGRQVKMIFGALTKKMQRMTTMSPPVETSWAKLYWPGKDFQTPHFKAPVALFKRPKQPFYYMKDEAMGWGERSEGGVHIYRIDFPHRMLRDPYVRELASHLLECLSWTAPGPLARLGSLARDQRTQIFADQVNA